MNRNIMYGVLVSAGLAAIVLPANLALAGVGQASASVTDIAGGSGSGAMPIDYRDNPDEERSYSDHPHRWHPWQRPYRMHHDRPYYGDADRGRSGDHCRVSITTRVHNGNSVVVRRKVCG